MMRYGTSNEALSDVLRLSKGMSYKNIMAELPYGGGKAVIIADPRKEKTPELLMAFAEQVARFGGRFTTGEDVGTTVADIEVMRRVTSHVRGIPENGPGDPSPMTALRGAWKLNEHINLLCAAGRDIMGDARVMVYVGLQFLTKKQ